MGGSGGASFFSFSISARNASIRSFLWSFGSPNGPFPSYTSLKNRSPATSGPGRSGGGIWFSIADFAFRRYLPSSS